ncbi:unnamed protein product, partial [Litomosoides sigmodontis]
MSRIDLKGLGGRCLPNNFDDFNFDALPEDDDLDCEQLNENIDAVNDETFGVDVDDYVLDDDLEQYSKQVDVLLYSDFIADETAGLQLDDETPKWFDGPTCSVSAPHPSELPTPPFGLNSFPTTNVSSPRSKNLEGFKMQLVREIPLGTTDTVWKNIDSTASSLGWSIPGLSALQHSSAYDFLNRKVAERVSSPDEKNNKALEECSDKSGIRSLAALPKNALTFEEIENILITSASKPVDSTAQRLPPGAVTLAELESQLLMQSSSCTTACAPDIKRSTDTLLSDSRIPPIIGPLPPPPLRSLSFPMLPPFAIQIAR